MKPLLIGEFCPNDCDRMPVAAEGHSVMRIETPYPGMGGRYRLVTLPQGGIPPDGWEYAGWMRDSGGQNIEGDRNWMTRDYIQRSARALDGSIHQLMIGERGGGGRGKDAGPWHPGYLVPM